MFYGSTLRQLFREFVAARARTRDEYDRDVHLAWRVEFFARQKTLKGLKRYLTKGGGAKVQTVEQQRSVLRALSAQYGIPLRQGDKQIH